MDLILPLLVPLLANPLSISILDSRRVLCMGVPSLEPLMAYMQVLALLAP
jgi:hypothetical protein